MMATLLEQITTVANRLKEAKAAYATAVRNQESSTIVSRAKAALDEAQKAYDLSAPQRSDLAKSKAKTDPDYLAAKKLQAEAEAEVTATAASKAEAEASLAGTIAVNDINEVLNGLEPTPAVVTKTEPKTVKSKTPKYDATGKLLGYDIVYSDGTTDFESGPSATIKKFTWKNPTTGQVESFDSEAEMNAAVETWKVTAGKEATNAATKKAAADARAKALADRTSAFDLLRDQFDQWGMADLVEPIRALIQDENVSPSEYAIRLRQTAPYQTRFKANAERVKNGLAAITEAEYLQLEDQYQNIMRNYGLPQSYYARGKYGVQEGFQNFIANDVSAVELEDRIMNAQNRVINSNPEVLAALKNFYPDINNGEILAYVLDPKNALDQIKRKITAAEIGGAATQAGLKTGMERAQELGAAGVTKAQAQEGFRTVAEVAPRGGQLAAMYGESPYTQQTAEQEVFGLAGSVDAAKQRKKLVGLERASFAGQAGTAQGALGRERAGNF